LTGWIAERRFRRNVEPRQYRLVLFKRIPISDDSINTGLLTVHMSFFTELKRRNVVKVSLAYLALSWVVIEVTTTVTPLLNLPEWLPKVAIWIGIIGFPFVAVFSWVYELSPDGLKRESEISHPSPAAQNISRRLYYITIGLVAVAIVLFVFDRFGPRPEAHALAPTGSEISDQSSQLDGRPAIAVLPFDNFSSDPEQAYFADGLAEDLITRLSSWRAFPVIARNSSFQFRGGDADLKQVSEELGARYIVEGSVRRAGSRIRVTAQLIDAASGENVWADNYEGEIADVFALQDEFSGKIAASLVVDLNRAEAERAQQRGTQDLEAWSLYQLGLHSADSYTREDFAVAREWFSAASVQDPRFATALAQLTFVNLWEVVLGWNDQPAEAIADALETARSAVSLDPRDPAAQAALGWAYVMSGDIDNGLDAARRAVELNPSMPEAWGWLSWNLLVAGDAEGSIVTGERAQRLNPLGAISSIVFDNLSQAYWQLGDYESGLRAARRLLAELPDYFLGHVDVAMNAVELGRLDEARAAIAEARRVQPELSLEFVQGMYGVARPEIDARRNAALRQAGLD
jgi:adenylate cyclase